MILYSNSMIKMRVIESTTAHKAAMAERGDSFAQFMRNGVWGTCVDSQGGNGTEYDAIEKVVIDRGELTLHVKSVKLFEVAQALRDTPALRFEVCLGVNGVHYPEDKNRELHCVYPLLSMTHNRRIRIEVSIPDSNPHLPSLVELWAGNNWHERETFDMFGVVFDGHPGLTRILMPDDWDGHPQRKDYPLGGIPVEYKGATVPPPSERRSYR